MFIIVLLDFTKVTFHRTSLPSELFKGPVHAFSKADYILDADSLQENADKWLTTVNNTTLWTSVQITLKVSKPQSSLMATKIIWLIDYCYSFCTQVRSIFHIRFISRDSFLLLSCLLHPLAIAIFHIQSIYRDYFTSTELQQSTITIFHIQLMYSDYLPSTELYSVSQFKFHL